MLTFHELREKNLARAADFKNSKGEVAHPGGDIHNWSPAQWLQAVTGELGEYANLRKKFERGDLTEKEFRQEAGKELADTMIYLDLLAASLNYNLDDEVVLKFNEVSHRVGSEVFFDFD